MKYEQNENLWYSILASKKFRITQNQTIAVQAHVQCYCVGFNTPLPTLMHTSLRPLHWVVGGGSDDLQYTELLCWNVTINWSFYVKSH
jgi:hypothetical protein